MDKIRVALVGCGGMGTRHLYGLRELAQTPLNNVELAALCDIDRETAELAASEVEDLLGHRPPVFTDLEVMARDVPDLDAVDVVTDASVHHEIACAALELGLHVMVEKPMAITVGACRRMIEAAERNDRVLSVAENYRRDPSARLINHLLKEGVIGTPYLATYHAMRPGNDVFCTAWRHLKAKGGLVLDIGVHFTDLIRYQLGDVVEVYGNAWIVEPVRITDSVFNWANSPYAIYRKRFAELDPEVPVTAEDTAVAMFRMESGAMVSLMLAEGGHGQAGHQLIFGDRGIFNGFGSRGSKACMQKYGEEEISHEQLVASAEGFALATPLEEHFFPERVTTGNADWRILAVEYHELAEAILHGGPVEVDGTEGMKDVAALYAILESSVSGSAVKISDVESCGAYTYQAEIDASLGIG